MGRRNQNCAEKWEGFKDGYLTWWGNLTMDNKVAAKKKFSKQSLTNDKQKHKFPEMWDLSSIRISQLSNKQIYRIWVFRDRDENLK